MAHLTDMEELLSSVPSQLVRDYMREAMSCYMAAAYRGCIVLSYIALFDDLLAKLGELGKVNSAAKSIYIEANKKKDDQDVFETYLIDQLGAKNLLSGLDTAFLNTLRNLRNKSAHPSGHKPSAEEARFVFFEAINRFLSRPILTTTQLVDEIVSRLSNGNFFPTALIEDAKEVVREEIADLHPEAIPQLVAKLITADQATGETVRKNAGNFLCGLAALDHVHVNKELQSKLLQGKSDDPNYSQLVLRIISANGKLVRGLPITSISRIRKVFSKQIEEVKASMPETKLAHPTSVFISLSHHFDDDKLTDLFGDELRKLFDTRPYSSFLVSGLNSHPKITNIYFEQILKKAGSSTFETANAFAGAVAAIDNSLAPLMTDEQAFKLIVAVIVAANWGAFGSQGVTKNKFHSVPLLRDKAISYANSKKASAKAHLKKEDVFEGKIADFVDQYLTADDD